MITTFGKQNCTQISCLFHLEEKRFVSFQTRLFYLSEALTENDNFLVKFHLHKLQSTIFPVDAPFFSLSTRPFVCTHNIELDGS
jgi:hypothetical protein